MVSLPVPVDGKRQTSARAARSVLALHDQQLNAACVLKLGVSSTGEVTLTVLQRLEIASDGLS
jgi:hypothetical protein